MTSESRYLSNRPAWWTLPHLLSLDAVSVGLVWMWMFAECLEIHIFRQTYTALALAIWCIYVADRLLDARKVTDEIDTTERHRFYARHRKIFAPLLLLAVGTAIYHGFYSIPAGILVQSGVIVLMVLYYFLHVHSRVREFLLLLPKEYLCGFIFAAGVSFPAYWNAGKTSLWEWVDFPVFAFAAVCAMNCYGIACWENGRDGVEKDKNAITEIWPMAEEAYPSVLVVTALILILGIGFFWSSPMLPIFYCALVSVFLLFGIHKNPIHLTRRAQRILADVALLTPLPFLLLFT